MLPSPNFERLHVRRHPYRLISGFAIASVILALIGTIHVLRQSSRNTYGIAPVVVATLTPTPDISIIVVRVVRGDSSTTLARRAITQSLPRLGALTDGQRVYMESHLRDSVQIPTIKEGVEVQVNYHEIESRAREARALSLRAVARWEKYATGVIF